MGRFILTTILLLAFAGAVQAATPASERRTALVIGNADYSLISPLRNPVNDARAMARVLRDLGFEVTAKENLNQKELKRAIRDFGRKLGQGGVGLFYYAGHGVEVDGANYLVPLESPIQFEDDVEIEAVDVNMVLGKMASAANRLNIVILDACRNNPYARSFRSTARGLAQIDAPSGTLIAYAARPGGVALDGDGENGLYTGALLEAMQLPGLRIEDVFKRVRVVVQEKSERQQVPWESSSLTGDFYFTLNLSLTVEAPEAPQSAAQQDTVFWQSIEDSNDPAMFDAYLQQFPYGTFVGVARLKREALIEAEQREMQTATVVPPPEASIRVEELDATFVALKTSNVRAEPTTDSERIGVLTRDDPIAVTGKVLGRNWYRIIHQDRAAFVFGSLISEVDPGEITAWNAVARSSDAADHEGFLAEFPKGHFAERARARIEQLSPAAPEPEEIDFDLAFWESIKDSTNPADYEAYLQQYSQGHFAALARARLTDTTEAQRIESEREIARELQRKEAAEAERRAAEPAFWNSIKESKNSADYQAYIKTYPFGRYVELARIKMMGLALTRRKQIRVQTEASADATSIASTDLSTYAAVTPTPITPSDPKLSGVSNKSICAIAAMSSGASTPISWDPNNTRYIDEAKRRGLTLTDCATILGRRPSTYAAVTPTPVLSRSEVIEIIKSKTLDQVYNYFRREYIGQDKYSSLKPNTAAVVCVNWEKSTPNYVVKSTAWRSYGYKNMIYAKGRAYKGCYNKKKKMKRDCECHYIYENDKKVLEIPTDFIAKFLKQYGYSG